MPEEILIREARVEDAAAVARVHVDTWRTAYAGLMPGELLAGLRYEDREALWRQRLGGESPSRSDFVAETAESGVVGFACGGKSRSPELPFDSELYGLYVLQTHQGLGAGKRLAHKVMDWLMEAGYNSMFLWTLKDGPSRGFYRSIGGRLLSFERMEDFGGKKLAKIAYGWDELRQASGALEPRL